MTSNLAAEMLKGLAHRGQVAGVVVDEGDHNSPFVLGSIFASCLSFAHATRKRTRERLEHASIL